MRPLVALEDSGSLRARLRPGHRPFAAACRCNQTYTLRTPRLLVVDGAGTVLFGPGAAMLTSLFGDLRAARDTKAKSSDFEDTEVVGVSQDFAATPTMESIATEVNERGQ